MSNDGLLSGMVIMVIDDSTTVQEILRVGLGREGATVVGFLNGIAAFHWFLTPGSCVPDLVIVDIGLPKMDGYEVTRRLKARPALKRTAIVMLTRRSGMIDRLKGRLAGACDYLTKPFEVHEVVQTLVTHRVVPHC